MTDIAPVAGVLLAGGLGRRMGGGDKPMRALAGRPLLAHAVERARAQTRALVLNVNGDPARFAAFGLPTVADDVPGFAGPLAGILAGMGWARRAAPDCPWLASFATDAPFVPLDMVRRLLSAAEAEGAPVACAMSAGRTHPVFALWSLTLAEDLRRALVEEDIRKIDRWTARYPMAYAEWPSQPIDPFFNVNTPEDLAAAEHLAKELQP